MKINLVLLGTGGGPRMSRGTCWPTSMVLDVGGRPYLIDAGLGVTRQFVEAGYDLADLHTVIVTHHHSDHNLELGPLLHTTWVSSYPRSLNVYGPPGITELIEGFLLSLKFDIETRQSDEGQYPLKSLIRSNVYTEGPVLEDDRVKVFAMRVNHPPVYHCYALRFEIADKIIVFSSDTSALPKLGDFAQGADVLVHEVFHYERVKAMAKCLKEVKPNLLDHIVNGHTKAEEVGIIANIAEASHLVLNHIIPRDEKNIPRIDIYDQVRKTWKGKLTIGHDLMRIPL